MRIRLLATLVTLACCSHARGDGFAGLGEHSRLANHAIVEVGDVEKMEPPPGTKWSSEVLRINSRCFEVGGFLGFWGFGKKAGMLLVDQSRSTKLALLEVDLSSIKVEIKPVQIVDCPSPFSGGDPAKLIEEIKRQNAEIQRKIEQLKRHNKMQ